MLRAYSKYLWIVGVVALLLTVGASTSEAFWPHHYGCRCATCCLDVVAPCCPPVIPAYSVAYSPCCPTFGYALGIRPGPVRRAVFGPYRWYAGWDLGYLSGWYGGWTTGIVEPCCQSTPVNGTLTPTPAPNKPQSAPTAPTPAVPAAPKATSAERPDAGQVTIWVPESAKVYVNGYETKSTGNLRQFVSYGLKPGMSYNYTIRAVVVRDGRTLEETHALKLVAGQRSAVAFNFNKPSNSSLASVW